MLLLCSQRFTPILAFFYPFCEDGETEAGCGCAWITAALPHLLPTCPQFLGKEQCNFLLRSPCSCELSRSEYLGQQNLIPFKIIILSS